MGEFVSSASLTFLNTVSYVLMGS